VLLGIDQSFHLIGRAFLFSPWAASGDVTVSEAMFWAAGSAPDVVFLGDSRVGNGVDPRLVDDVLAARGQRTTSVNVWLAGAGPDDFLKIARNVLAPNAPRLIVCAINENALAWDGPEARSFGWQPAGLDWNELLPDLDRWSWRATSWSGTLRWGAFVRRAAYNAFYDALRFANGAPWPESGLGQRRGYMPRSGRQRESRLLAQARTDERRYPRHRITPWAERRWLEFLRATHDTRLSVVVVLLPVHPDVRRRFADDRYEAFTDFVERTTREAGVTFVNMYQEPALNTDAFFDYHHLNERGAALVSRRLADVVIRPLLAVEAHAR
jgi:hypothetical protein